MASYFAAGGPTGVDIVGTHGYVENFGNQPESLEQGKATAWHPMMLQYGLANKPIWDTEGSWGLDTAAGLDADARAAFLARFYLLHWSAGITKFYWYAWDSSTWGTLSSSGTPNKAGLAYTQVYNWMTGATMPQACTAQGKVYSCPLTRPNGYNALAVWDSAKTCTTAGGCDTSSYTAPPSFTQYQDLTGAVTAIQSGQIISIGAKPILLETNSINP